MSLAGLRERLSKFGKARLAKTWIRIVERRKIHGERALEIHRVFLYLGLYTSLHMNRVKIA